MAAPPMSDRAARRLAISRHATLMRTWHGRGAHEGGAKWLPPESLRKPRAAMLPPILVRMRDVILHLGEDVVCVPKWAELRVAA